MSEVLLVLVMTALCCSLIGPIVILKNMSMVADALSHSILLGIVISFIFVRDLSSIWLILGAAIFGIITVLIVELLVKLRLVKNQDGLGFIFPIFFSLGVIIISKFFRNVHLDIDVVLMGNPLFSPFIRMWGLPKDLIIMILVFLINLIFIILSYQRLKISLFDEDYARLQGIKINLLYYLSVCLISITSVSAFNIVGAILVISFLVAPAASAYLLSKNLMAMIFISLMYGLVNVFIGFHISMILDVSLSGACAFISLITCLLTIVFCKNGYIHKLFYRRLNKKQLRMDLILIHLYRHPNDINETGYTSIHKHLNWSSHDTEYYLSELVLEDYIEYNDKLKIYVLKASGLKRVEYLLAR